MYLYLNVLIEISKGVGSMGKAEEIEEDYFYSKESREALLEEGEITNEEDGFMVGYEECMQGLRDVKWEDEI